MPKPMSDKGHITFWVLLRGCKIKEAKTTLSYLPLPTTKYKHWYILFTDCFASLCDFIDSSISSTNSFFSLCHFFEDRLLTQQSFTYTLFLWSLANSSKFMWHHLPQWSFLYSFITTIAWLQMKCQEFPTFSVII